MSGALLLARQMATTRPIEPLRAEVGVARIGRSLRARPLPWLMLLAAVLRCWAALTPGFHHPDAIYQYLEPAHRLLTGEGVVTWEWRLGIRSWLLPALLAVPLGIGEAVDPAGPLPMLLPRLATASASLGIVWAAWTIGRRHSLVCGALAGFVAATWFELVFFSAETLAEPLATAALLPAVALLTASRQTARTAAIAGALIGFAALARPHYGPAAAAAVLIAWWPSVRGPERDLARWAWLFAGAAAIAAISAIVDAANGLTPFAWIAANIDQNIVHNVAARYGTFPLLSYVAWFTELWHPWIVAVAIGVLRGWRRCPALLAMAAVTVALHSVIPHKEYRFIFLAFAAFIVLAAIGWGEIVERFARSRGGVRGGQAAIAVFVAWGLASAVLAQGFLAPNQLRPNTAGTDLFAHLRRDPLVCGVALVEPASFANVPGMVALRRHVPVAMFWTDPTMGHTPWQNVRRWDAGFNRIVTLAKGYPVQPPRIAPYHVETCEPMGLSTMCILARDGDCPGAARSPFAINRVMTRLAL